jgi:hypothetical protein
MTTSLLTHHTSWRLPPAAQWRPGLALPLAFASGMAVMGAVVAALTLVVHTLGHF